MLYKGSVMAVGNISALGVYSGYKCLSTLMRGNEIVHEKLHNPSVDQEGPLCRNSDISPIRRLFLCIPFGGLEAGTSQVRCIF